MIVTKDIVRTRTNKLLSSDRFWGFPCVNAKNQPIYNFYVPVRGHIYAFNLFDLGANRTGAQEAGVYRTDPLQSHIVPRP